MTNNSFTDKVRSAIMEYNMTAQGDAVVVALSGGADSVSLLFALKELEQELGITLSACHVNHNLRGSESDGDMQFCRGLCERIGVPLEVRSVDVLSQRQKHEGVEETARRARYSFFEELLSRQGEHSRLATAHNSNDCAETVLLNMLRGTGLKGLCGVPPVRGRIIRPLIYCTRSEVERFCAEHELSFVTDSTNLSDDYTRNRVRHTILPEMQKINPALLECMTRMQQSLRQDSAYLEQLAEHGLESARVSGGYSAAVLCALPQPVLSRAVQLVLKEGGIEPSALRINTAIGLLQKGSGRFNPCKNRFFTVKKGVAFVEALEQHYKKHEKKLPQTKKAGE